ncbi:MAG: aldehyde ferredoxin oxidoreductase C-terminal domain-containing protein [Candidatus Adiutrix sp.]
MLPSGSPRKPATKIKAKSACQACPVNCRPRNNPKKNHLAAFTKLWAFEPPATELATFLPVYHHHCNDLGLEAFEVARAIAACQVAGIIPFGDCEAILQLLTQINDNTPLGQMIGAGPRKIKETYNIDFDLTQGPQKHMTNSPDEAFMDSMGLCAFGSLTLNSDVALKALAELLEAKYQRPFTLSWLKNLGPTIIALESNYGDDFLK